MEEASDVVNGAVAALSVILEVFAHLRQCSHHRFKFIVQTIIFVQTTNTINSTKPPMNFTFLHASLKMNCEMGLTQPRMMFIL